MNLPADVEATSFEPGVSASSNELDSAYLEPLGLTRHDVYLVDLMPYFLANTRASNGRTMWDRIKQYEQFTGDKLQIQPRPSPAQLVRLASSMPGNVERLTEYMRACSPRLVLTLGAEAAAFARGETYTSVSRRVDDVLYAAPERRALLGMAVDVVHLAHPGALMGSPDKPPKWRLRHQGWVRDTGGPLVQDVMAAL